MGFLKRHFFGFLASFSAINKNVRSETTVQSVAPVESPEGASVDQMLASIEVEAAYALSQFAFLNENSPLVRATDKNGTPLKTHVNIKPSGDRIEIDE